jgi:hypothetical protein
MVQSALMEDKTRALIVTGAVLLIILALIIAAIFYLIRFIQGRTSSTSQNQQTRQINFSPSPAASGIPGQQTSGTTPNPGGTQVSGDVKNYNGNGFQLSYPKNWGLLTCSNSQNVEFDPYSPVDQLGVQCDYAQKPVTVVVGVTCNGATTDVGGVPVVKSKRDLSKGVENSWCLNAGNTGLQITNRVSTQDARGYGKDDISNQIEQMIARMRVGNAS